MNPFYGSRLKLRRAEKHLNSIKGMIDSFIASKPYSFVLEANPTPPNYVIVAKVSHLPDEELGLMVGDFAHNARSALDLLVYQLSQLPSTDKKRGSIQFPLFDCSQKYGGYAEAYLAGVAPENVAIIEDFQPYKRVNGFYDDALGILHSINNSDKHRIINIVGSLASFNGLGFGAGQVGTNTIRGGGIGIIVGHRSTVDFGNGFTYAGVGDGIISKDGTIVAKITSNASPQVKMHPDFGISIQFGEGNARVQGRPVVEILTFIYDRVKEVIGKFESVPPK